MLLSEEFPRATICLNVARSPFQICFKKVQPQICLCKKEEDKAVSTEAVSTEAVSTEAVSTEAVVENAKQFSRNWGKFDEEWPNYGRKDDGMGNKTAGSKRKKHYNHPDLVKKRKEKAWSKLKRNRGNHPRRLVGKTAKQFSRDWGKFDEEWPMYGRRDDGMGNKTAGTKKKKHYNQDSSKLKKNPRNHPRRLVGKTVEKRVLQVYGYARTLAKLGIAKALTEALQAGIGSDSLVSASIALKSIAVNDEICKSIAETGGIDTLLRCIDDSGEQGNKTAAKACCSLLAKLAGSDSNKSTIVEKRGLDKLIKLAQRFEEDPLVIQEVMICILCLRSADHAASDLAVQAMERFPAAVQCSRNWADNDVDFDGGNPPNKVSPPKLPYNDVDFDGGNPPNKVSPRRPRK